VGRITLILGGARSGKSTYALEQAQKLDRPVTFIATATAGDEEMRLRIIRHQSERPDDWETLEAPFHIANAIKEKGFHHSVVILDCITLLVSNLLMGFDDPETMHFDDYIRAIDEEINSLLDMAQNSKADWFIVSNEVGLGLVPPYKMGRDYRDGLGRVNQKIAALADRVVFMVAGLPMVVK
jgi:adenosylcobinamide kinase/adenosylcobinamide-phosphate guanylyltransferase